MRSENWSNHAESNAMDMIIYGRVVPDSETIAAIEAVTPNDLSALAKRLFAGRPTLASLGPIDKVAPYEDILKRLNHA
jgi:predicted Zn-dependent peptidase